MVKLQDRFAQMVADLISYIRSVGYLVTLGEAYRPPEMCTIYAEQGKGINNSLHQNRLAIDLNIFKDNILLEKVEDYEFAGLWFESRGGNWGGRFSKPDADHFSLSIPGIDTK